MMDVDEALRVLLTKSQLTVVKQMTPLGYSKLQAVRRLISLGVLASKGGAHHQPLNGIQVVTTNKGDTP